MLTQPSDRNWSRLVKALLLGAERQGPFRLFVGSAMTADLLDVLEAQTLEIDGFSAADVQQLSPMERDRAFRAAWGTVGPRGRFERFTEASKASTPGDRMERVRPLARLIAKGIFDVIVTTDMTPALENALAGAGLERSDADVLTLGAESDATIDRRLGFESPRVKIVKLRGSAPLWVFDFDVVEHSRALTQKLLAGRVVLVGHHPLRDIDITRAIPESDEELFYVCVSEPAADSAIGARLSARRTTYVVTGGADPTTFFLQLSRELVGDQAGDVGLRGLVESGLPVADMPDAQFEELRRAAAEVGPLVELVKPILDTLRTERGRSRTQALGADASPAGAGEADIVEMPERTVLRIDYDDRMSRLSFTAAGAIQYSSASAQPLRLDVNELNEALRSLARDLKTYLLNGDAAGRDGWRARAKREGKMLFKDMFAGYSELMEKLGTARFASADEDLHLSFVGPRHHLGMPYELLYQDKPWAIQNPIVREITGVTVRNPSFAELLATLRRTKQPLRVLLVAADTGGTTAEQEVGMLEAKIRAKADALGLKVEVTRVGPTEASVERLEQLFGRNAGAHVIHYSGHSEYEKTGEDSGLILYDKPSTRQGIRYFNARRLATCLGSSPAVLVYFSSCVGAMVGSSALLTNYDYIGLMDAAVAAGIPVVFGYRWYVRDASARRFAGVFYEALLETQSPAAAVMRARQDIYHSDAMDETWTSPILVAQRM